MKDTIVISHVSDDYYNDSGVNEFVKSFKKFHPDIPLEIVTSKKLDKLMNQINPTYS